MLLFIFEAMIAIIVLENRKVVLTLYLLKRRQHVRFNIFFTQQGLGERIASLAKVWTPHLRWQHVWPVLRKAESAVWWSAASVSSRYTFPPSPCAQWHTPDLTKAVLFSKLLFGVDTKIQRSLRMRDVTVFQKFNTFLIHSANLNTCSKWNHRREYKIEMYQAVCRSIST